MLSAIPTASSSGSGNYDVYTHRNFSEFVATIWSLKVDHSFTQNSRVSVYWQRYDDTTGASTGLEGALNQANDSISRMDGFRVNHDHVFTPTLLLHTLFSYSATTAGWTDPYQHGYGSKFGFGTQGDADATPQVSWRGLGSELTAWGNSQGKVNNGGQWNYIYQFAPQLTWVRGKHESNRRRRPEAPDQ